MQHKKAASVAPVEKEAMKFPCTAVGCTHPGFKSETGLKTHIANMRIAVADLGATAAKATAVAVLAASHAAINLPNTGYGNAQDTIAAAGAIFDSSMAGLSTLLATNAIAQLQPAKKGKKRKVVEGGAVSLAPVKARKSPLAQDEMKCDMEMAGPKSRYVRCPNCGKYMCKTSVCGHRKTCINNAQVSVRSDGGNS
jgi:hypothetical protein